MRTAKKLTKVFQNSSEISFDDKSKIVIMSDCHRGDGTWSDDFLRNKPIIFRALNYYFDNGYTYIEIGDGDELWENKNIKDIIKEHRDIYTLIKKFNENNRLYMLYGNHDNIKKNYSFVKNKNESLYEFNKIKSGIYEGLILKHQITNDKIFLVHGNQGDLINDGLAWLSKFLVRNFWRKLEIIGINNPTSSAKNYHKKKKHEEKMAKWADKNGQMLIAGHTHRPVFPKVGESLYFNDGSCIHPYSITGIEIENGLITLVKWDMITKEDGCLFVHRDPIVKPGKLKDYFNSTNLIKIMK